MEKCVELYDLQIHQSDSFPNCGAKVREEK